LFQRVPRLTLGSVALRNAGRRAFLLPSCDRTCNKIFPLFGGETKKGLLELIAPEESNQGFQCDAALQ
jgi:hypothetical protein